MRTLLTLVLATLPALASAQVVVLPPSPPVYYAPPAPPRVWIRQRVRWHLRHAGVFFVPPPVVAPLPPPIIVETPSYPPQVYAAPSTPPLPPIPPPMIVPPPVVYCCAPPPRVTEEIVVARPALAPWSARVGLGFRGSGLVADDGWNTLGVGGELLYRASPHLVTEVAAEYQHNPTGMFDRRDVPVTFGLRVHLGTPQSVLSPYFVFAGGLDFADENLLVTHDRAMFVEGQIGGGIELRIGPHLAITADARLDGRKRSNDASEAVVNTRSVDGKPVHALDDQVGGQFRLGAAVYF